MWYNCIGGVIKILYNSKDFYKIKEGGKNI